VKKKIRTHTDLEVYRKAFDAAMRIFELSKRFPKEETYSLTDQIRRASRSVCANLAEAWRKRRYEAAFLSKLSDSETEAAETQVWLQFAVKCGYLTRDEGKVIYVTYDEILGTLVGMITHPVTPSRRHQEREHPMKRTKAFSALVIAMALLTAAPAAAQVGVFSKDACKRT
jgi:four helix bundle protein